MATDTQKEQISISYINLYVDTTKSLRSHISVNDKLPIWDGEILAYEGDPDTNKNLIGKVMVQGKSTGVSEFNRIESHYIKMNDLRNYMHSEGILYFVVELQPDNGWRHRIFYRFLTPSDLKQFYRKYHNKQQSVNIHLHPVPADNHRFEQELKDFLHDSVKQQSFIDKPTLRLVDAIDKDKPTTFVTSFITKEKGDWAWQITSQPVYLYKQTPYADIPVEDTPFFGQIKNVYNNPVSVEGTLYFDRYYLTIGYGYVDIIIDNCMELHTPRKGFEEDFLGTFNLTYKFHFKPDECLHRLCFLRHAVTSNTITLNTSEYPLCIPSDKQTELLSEIQNAIDILTDMKKVWTQLHIAFDLDYADYSDNEIDELCNLVAHIYRKMPCRLYNDNHGRDASFNLFKTGPLNFIFYAYRLSGTNYTTIDPFVTNGMQQGFLDETHVMPFLSTAIRRLPGYLFDNIDYDDQLLRYRECLKQDNSVVEFIKEDIDIIRQLSTRISQRQKQQKIKTFIQELETIVKE